MYVLLPLLILLLRHCLTLWRLNFVNFLTCLCCILDSDNHTDQLTAMSLCCHYQRIYD